MNSFKIINLTTTEINTSQFNSYLDGINCVFKKKFSFDDLLKKYACSSKGYSYHALCFDSESNVVAALTAIPVAYNFNDIQLQSLLLVDFFVNESFRKDVLLGVKLLKGLLNHPENKDVAFVYAIPNDNAYQYWKKLFKFNDAFTCSIYVLPVKAVGDISTKLYKSFLGFYISFLLFFIRNEDNKLKNKLYLDSSTIINANKFKDNSFQLDLKTNTIVKLDVDFGQKVLNIFQYSKYNESRKSLYLIVKDLLKTSSASFIIYFGKMPFFQLLFFRIPLHKKIMNRNFNLIYKITEPNFEYLDTILKNSNNWIFSNTNIDTR